MKGLGPRPFVAIALGLFAIAIVAALLVGGKGDPTGLTRSGSVYDDGPGGASVLRRHLEANGLRTATLESDRFALHDTIDVVFLIGVSANAEPTRGERDALRAFVQRGGTLIVATDVAVLERELLRAFDIGVTVRRPTPGEHDVVALLAAAPPVRRILTDTGVGLEPPAHGAALASEGGTAIAAAAKVGQGTVYAVGSLGPFLNGTIGRADNGRLALALADATRPGRLVAFDEYHHGIRGRPDPFAVLTGSWPGRALLLAGAAVLAYLALAGRRLGPPLPLDPRPARSSLDYIRSFAGLVRRSGRREIPRRRAREELRSGLARESGLDPATPFEAVVQSLARRDPARAARARRLYDALGEARRDDQLLRIVADVRALLDPRAAQA